MPRWMLLLLFVLAAAACSKEPAAGAPVVAAGAVAPPGGAAPVPPPVVGAPAAVPQVWAVGDKISGQWTNGQWYPGRISVVNQNGTFDVKYDDGDVSKSLPATKVRARKAGGGGGGGGGGGAGRAASDAPCPGPGITRRCNGVCVNLQEDDNNCGGCGNRCSDGKHCDGHLFCRDASGNL